MALWQVSGVKVYQAGEAQTSDEIIVEFDFMWSGQQVMLITFSGSSSHHDRAQYQIHIDLLLNRRGRTI